MTDDRLLRPLPHFCACGAEAQLVKQKSKTKPYRRYQVQCLDEYSCSNQGSQEVYAWQAVLSWNKSPLSEKPEYLEIPGYDFSNFFTVKDIKEFLKQRRLELEKIIHAKKEQGIKRHHPELEKLRVELAWIIYGQSWIRYYNRQKHQSLFSQSKSSEVCETPMY